MKEKVCVKRMGGGMNERKKEERDLKSMGL